ncbi:MAG: methyl-accepting chemotaxis protein [Rhodospirillales bacterium]|nr:methyl-accepting chemotaxis protein [Rhodospirillales bacterium]
MLARQTSEATAEIDATLKTLADQTKRLIDQSAASMQRAEVVQSGTTAIGGAFDTMGKAMTGVSGQVSGISGAVGEIEGHCESLIEALASITGGVNQSSRNLEESRVRIARLLVVAAGR